jgi:hypothetical protein
VKERLCDMYKCVEVVDGHSLRRSRGQLPRKDSGDMCGVAAEHAKGKKKEKVAVM